MRAWLALLLLCLATPATGAQPAAPPEPILRVSLDPPKTIVGQSTTLKIDVLAPNYMTRPPVVPDFQLRNAVTRAGSTVNMSEQRDGITYAGVRFEFLITPQEVGRYAISGQTVRVTYAADPPNTREATLSVPATDFEAIIPDAAQSLDPFVSATKLTVRQDIRRSSEQLKVGDAVTRTVTVEADGTPSMLLPQTIFAGLAGVRIYPDQPQLQDRFDRRTGALTASRIDRATYMLQQAGELTLPGFEIDWWDVHDGKVERARIEPVVIRVFDNPLANAPAVAERRTVGLREALLFLADRWRAVLSAIAVLAMLVWFLPPAARAAVTEVKRRRGLFRRSEACAYAGLRATARAGDPGRTYAALLHWLSRFEPVAPVRTIRALRVIARDAQLDREIAGLEQHLFAASRDPAGWSAHRLMQHIGKVRRRCTMKTSGAAAALPPTVNPRPVES